MVALFVVALSVVALSVQALALVYTFGSPKPGVQSLVSALICLAAALLHVAASPLRSPASQALQTVLLGCLAVVALASLPFAVSMDSASAGVGRGGAVIRGASTSDTFARDLQYVFGVVVPAVTAAAAMCVTNSSLRWLRLCSRLRI